MPKAEAGTPKAIANRIKAKGLQKLRWYCQMCQKQCRDENGFKCHTMSESHQRQLLLFADSPNKFLSTFSKEFKDMFLQLLKRQYGTKRIYANQIYQEYINDRHHIHMNSTQWETLTGFVKWLGKEGHCVVDQTEKGWFITYIDRDPETIQRQEALAKKEKMDLDDEERIARFVKKQVQKAKNSIEETPVTYTEFSRQNEDEKVQFKLGLASKDVASENPATKTLMPPPNQIFTQKDKSRKRVDNSNETQTESKKMKSALNDVMKEQEKDKERRNRKDYWLTKGIIVKLITKKLGEKYFKKKGVIQEVHELYTAKLKMLDSNNVIKVDQVHVETVIPACGRRVKVVNGAYRGEEAILESLDADNFCVKLKIISGFVKGRIVEKVAYEDICKIHNESS